MNKFTIVIENFNGANLTDDPCGELARILDVLAHRIGDATELPEHRFRVRDMNGNQVGDAGPVDRDTEQELREELIETEDYMGAKIKELTAERNALREECRTHRAAAIEAQDRLSHYVEAARAIRKALEGIV